MNQHMKLAVLGTLILVATLGVIVEIPGSVTAVGCAGANRFWVGGTGSWSSTLKWSASSGGASGASVPDSTNPVFFDASSGLGTATIDVTASSCDVTGTAMSLTTISMGSQTWKVYGDITDLEGAKLTIGTSTLELAGTSTQTIGLGVSTSNFNLYNLLVSGAGTKVVNNRFYPQGTFWRASTSVTMQFKPEASEVHSAVFTFQLENLIQADAGFVLTMRSTIAGTRWQFDPQTGGTVRTVFLRANIQDANGVISGAIPFIDATDYSNVDSGNNNNIRFSPRSSRVDTQASPGLSLDYGPQAFRNLLGDIVVSYNDGSVNNGNWYITYSTDGGRTWAARITLMSPTSGGILTANTGAGQEVYGYVDKNETLHITNHKLISGQTHVIYTHVNIRTAANVADWMQWESATGRRPPSQGNAVDGQGFDDLGIASDASVTVLSDGTIAVGLDANSGAAGPMAAQYYLPKANSWTARTVLSFGGNPTQDLAILVSDRNDNLHMFTRVSVGGVLSIGYLGCADAVRSDCTRAANWNGVGGASFDQVIASASGAFGFPSVVVDSENIVHVTSTSSFVVAGFCREWHNYLVPGATSWANGMGSNGGAEINGAAAFPSRTRPGCDVREGLVLADGGANAYIFYADQQSSFTTYHQFNGATRAWGDQIATMAINNAPRGILHARASSSTLDILAFCASSCPLTGMRWQAITGTPDANPWWDTVADVPPPSGIRDVDMRVGCSYTLAMLTCQDGTNYTFARGIMRVDWFVDGRQVATTQPGETVTILMPLSPRERRGAVLLSMVVRFENGGNPMRSWILEIDNTPLWGFAAILAFLFLWIGVGAMMGGRGYNTWFEPVRNPGYRDTAIKTSEDPPGWISYRQREPNYSRYRSKRVGDKWIVYGLRPASKAERARTGRRFVAEVQTVRERAR